MTIQLGGGGGKEKEEADASHLNSVTLDFCSLEEVPEKEQVHRKEEEMLLLMTR